MTTPATPWFARPLDAFGGEALTGTLIPPLVTGHHHDVDAAHEIFHEQTKYSRATNVGISRNISAFVRDPALILRAASGRRMLDGYSKHPLPDPEEIVSPIQQAFTQRRSTARSELEGDFEIGVLSTLLHHSLRSRRFNVPELNRDVRQPRRPYPSAGALFPLEIYVSWQPSREAGFVAHYDADTHLLRELPATNPGRVRSAEIVAEETPIAPCTIIITSVFERTIQKYGIRGYRLALLEAGHAAQNVLIAATALGLRSLVSASFYENELEQALDVDGVSECAISMVLLAR